MNIVHIGSPFKNIGGVSKHIDIIIKHALNVNIKQRHLYISRNKKSNFDIRYSLFNLMEKVVELKKICLNNKADIIHAHTQRAGFISILIKIFFLKNIKVFYTPHGFRHKQKKYISACFHLGIEKLLLNFIDHLFLLTLDELIFIKDRNYKKYTLLNNVIDVDDYKQKKYIKIYNKKKIILNISNLDSIKQPALFIEVAQKVIKKNKNIIFIWVGKISKEFLNIIPNNKNIIFTGYKKKKSIIKYLQSADLFFLTSRHETLPYVILEASYFKIKILINKFYNNNKFKDFNNLSTFNYNDARDAKNKIFKLLFDKNKNLHGLQKKYTDVRKFVQLIEKKYLFFI